MRALFLMLASPLVLPMPAAEKPVPVVDEPLHKTVFENEYVRVIDVQIKPGETSLYHIHVIPSVIVYLTKSTNRSESWPDKAILTRDITPGQSRYAPYDEKPLSHRVTNTGPSLFRVWDIELLKKPVADPTLPALASPNVKPHWDEKLVRSSTVQLAAKEKIAIPAAKRAFLVVPISGTIEATSDSTKPKASRALKWGDYLFIPAQSRLELANAGAGPAETVLLELKG